MRENPPTTSAAGSLDWAAIAGRLAGRRGRPAEARWRRRVAGAIPWCVWCYVAGVAAVWLVLRVGGDRWWFPTLMLFGPRWIYALPLVVLGPPAALLKRRMLWPLLVAALIVLGPVMGFCLPWARLVAPNRPTIRVLTCNVKGRCRDNQALNALIRETSPDVVALQGCWGDVRVDWPAGWHVCSQGELLVASRYPLRKLGAVQRDGLQESRPRANLLSCLVATPERDLCFCTIHPQSPRRGIEQLLSRRTVLQPAEGPHLAAEIQRRWRDSEDTVQWLARYGEPQVIAGDLNLPPDSPIYRRFWAGYCNAFSRAGLGFGYTEWPRMRTLWFGIRIDHILSGPHWRPRRCWVGPDVGSDHLPLIADLYWAD